MPKAVSDSSTLIHLAGIGRLKLLRQFYKKILIPPAVWKEVVEEVQSQLYTALDQGYISQETFDTIYETLEVVAKQLSRFIMYLKGSG